MSRVPHGIKWRKSLRHHAGKYANHRKGYAIAVLEGKKGRRLMQCVKHIARLARDYDWLLDC